MGLINYSNYEDEDTQIEKVTPVEVIDNTHTQYEILPAQPKNRGDEAWASAISPYAAIASVANSAFDFASTVSKCVTLVSLEKQKTEQYRINANVKKEEFKQKTKQVKIIENQITKRIIAECQEKLEEKKMELLGLRENNRMRETELQYNHELYLQDLHTVHLIVNSLLDEKNTFCRLLIDNMKYDRDKENKKNTEYLLSSLDNANKRLVEITGQLLDKH